MAVSCFMIAKYKIEYGIKFHGHTQSHDYHTDDPVTCEQFLSELLHAKGDKLWLTSFPKAPSLETWLVDSSGNIAASSAGLTLLDAESTPHEDIPPYESRAEG